VSQIREHSAKRSHASSDSASRAVKAAGIEEVLLHHVGSISDADVLDIGTGAGFIASYFAARCRSVTSIDIVDERAVFDYGFKLVASELLPFDERSIDIVISNHVIEHVDHQLLHLREIARVLRPSGVAYLATPNRFAVIEPHFKLPLLSWAPTLLRDPYVRFTRRGSRYDVQPLTRRMLLRLAVSAGLTVHEKSLHVARRRLWERTGFDAPLPRLIEPALPSFVMTLTHGSAR
jgi:SAM-dependent methyltransferase